jgi:integrase/recombinase XerD
VEIFFTDKNFKIGGHSFPGVPFFVDSEYHLLDDLNEFFTNDLLVDGKINSPKTWKSYAYWLNDYLQWAVNNGIDWKAASKKEIVAYRNWSLEECGLSPTTVNSRLTVIKRFYAYAVRERLVDNNPVTEVDASAWMPTDSDLLSHTHKLKLKRNDLSVKVSHELPKIFSDIEIKRLFNAASSERLWLMMRLMLECGLRREEVARLPAKVFPKTAHSNLIAKLNFPPSIHAKLKFLGENEPGGPSIRQMVLEALEPYIAERLKKHI